jgi:hypothetical protein
MEQRAPSQVERDDDLRALYRKLDFFPTPPWAARAGAELIQAVDPDARFVWEPACGEGHIAEPLREYFKVYATDIHRYGCNVQCDVDFLKADQLEWLFGADEDMPDWVVTNPPFPKAAEFVSRGLEVARRGVAVLCRMAFLESAGRFPLHFQSRYPLYAMAPFTERVPMQLGSWNPHGSTATAYAWFFYRKPASVAGQGLALKSPIIIPIPPGTRARLTRPDDAARFGHQRSSPVFSERAAP